MPIETLWPVDTAALRVIVLLGFSRRCLWPVCRHLRSVAALEDVRSQLEYGKKVLKHVDRRQPSVLWNFVIIPFLHTRQKGGQTDRADSRAHAPGLRRDLIAGHPDRASPEVRQSSASSRPSSSTVPYFEGVYLALVDPSRAELQDLFHRFLCSVISRWHWLCWSVWAERMRRVKVLTTYPCRSPYLLACSSEVSDLLCSIRLRSLETPFFESREQRRSRAILVHALESLPSRLLPTEQDRHRVAPSDSLTV